MKGLDLFATHFSDFSEQYIVIGGTACDIHFQSVGLDFRVTKDIDLVLVMEAIDSTFVEHFWAFIREGRYEKKEVAREKKYYRFTKPENKEYPVQLELSSRRPDVISEKEDMKYTPIPMADPLSSLSAVLMDDDYYEFTLKHSSLTDSVKHADEFALICLKAKAYLDLSDRKEKSRRIDSSDIKKHKNDIFRLAATLTDEPRIDMPEKIQRDLSLFLDQMTEDPPRVQQFLPLMGITGVDADMLLGQLRDTFQL